MAHIRLVRDESGLLREVGVPEEPTQLPSPADDETVVKAMRALDVPEPSAMDLADKDSKDESPPPERAEKGSAVCEVCGFVAASEFGLKAHARAKHKE